MHRGMRAWMQAWAYCTMPAPPMVVPDHEAILPLDMHQEVAMILAGMVLYGRKEAIA